MFTIRSVSAEGEYFLVNHWDRNRAFWKLASEIRPEDMFKTAGQAKASLTKLLKVMEEYRSDIFSIVETDTNSRIISEVEYTPALSAI